MKMVYISRGAMKNRADINPLGTEKKIQQQISALNKLGVVVSQLYPETYTSYLPLNFIVEKFITPMKYLIHRKLYDQNTVVYIRREYHHLSYLPLLFSSRIYKVVIETQTNERAEYRRRLSGSPLNIFLSWYNYTNMLLFEKSLKLKADAIISVTNEVEKHNRALTKNKLHYLCLGNGIDTSQIKIRTCPIFKGQEIQLLCVANVALWHGLDRLIHGMSEYNGSQDIYLHIVGDGSALPNIRKLVSTLHLENQVIFHGHKSGTDLDAMFDQCHIAVGSLGGFRINMHEMSSLKSGEYCARGIPFILAATAMDFPKNWPYILHVPETETPINMDDVIEFADRVLADPNHVQEMREYAESHLDWMIKMKILKEFLENL